MFQYDVFGSRVERTTLASTTNFLYGLNPVQELFTTLIDNLGSG